MAILTLENLAAGKRQVIPMIKGGVSVFGYSWYSQAIHASGFPTNMSALSNKTNGVVPVAGDTGLQPLQPFTGAAFLTGFDVTALRPGRVLLYDRLFHAGQYNQNAENTTLSSQPSFSSRVPGGTDYSGLMLYHELISKFITPSSYTVTVTYTNQDGTTGKSTSLVVSSTGSSTGDYWALRVPLASGDTGIQTIESVSTGAGPGGAFNLFIARPLLMVRCETDEATGAYPQSVFYPGDRFGFPQVFPDTAFCTLYATNSDGVGPALYSTIEIVSE